MSDALRRAARGTIQVGLAEGAIQFVEAFIRTFNEAQHVATLWLLTTVVTFVQNWLEDNTAMPALLKAPPSPGVNPVPDEAGAVNLTTVLLLVITVCVVATTWHYLGIDLNQ